MKDNAYWKKMLIEDPGKILWYYILRALAGNMAAEETEIMSASLKEMNLG